MGLFRRKHRDEHLRPQDASERLTDTQTVDERNRADYEAIARKRSAEVMEQWTDVPMGKQKSDGSGERR